KIPLPERHGIRNGDVSSERFLLIHANGIACRNDGLWCTIYQDGVLVRTAAIALGSNIEPHNIGTGLGEVMCRAWNGRRAAISKCPKGCHYGFVAGGEVRELHGAIIAKFGTIHAK